MRKFSILMLAAVMLMGLAGLSGAAEVMAGSKAADVTISGKVDFRYNIGGASGTKGNENFVFNDFNLREARLTANAVFTDKISAQVSNNFCASSVAGTLETNNLNIGDTYINFDFSEYLNILVGQSTIPGIAIRETILNQQLSSKFTSDNNEQINISGKASVVLYGITFVDGNVNTETGGTSKDIILNGGVEFSGVTLGAAYNLDLDVNDIDAQNGSYFATNAGYSIKEIVDLNLQYIGGLKSAVTGALDTSGVYKDISDTTEDAPTSEIVAEVGLNIKKVKASIGYDIFGKSDAIILKCNIEIADGVSGIIRADILGSKYRDNVALAANNISLGVAAEF